MDMARCDQGQVRVIHTRRKLPQIQYIDKIVGVAVTVHRQVPTAPVRGTTCDLDVQKAVELPQVQHTERIIDVRAVIQHQTAIRTVHEKAEVPESQQLDRAVDVAVEIQPMHSRRSPSVKLRRRRYRKVLPTS